MSQSVTPETHTTHVEAVGRLLVRPVSDDGVGPYIRLIDRPVGNGLIAFIPDPDEVDHTLDGWDRWRIQDDETGDLTFSTDLTSLSPASDVAEWLRAQIAVLA